MNTDNTPKHIPLVATDAELQLTEMFYSLQGECDTTGAPTIFIRLTGCPLRCVYCDTTYSFYGGEPWTIDKVLSHIAQFPCKRVCVTGGEPLAQKHAITLMQALLDNDYEVSLETAGALPIKKVPTAVSRVVDLKTPSSGEEHRNFWDNVNWLTKYDQIKFVIMNKTDYDWAKMILHKHELATKVNTVWFSPMFDTEKSHQLPTLAKELAEWILADALPVRLQLQLHKLLWADAMGK